MESFPGYLVSVAGVRARQRMAILAFPTPSPTPAQPRCLPAPASQCSPVLPCSSCAPLRSPPPCSLRFPSSSYGRDDQPGSDGPGGSELMGVLRLVRGQVVTRACLFDFRAGRLLLKVRLSRYTVLLVLSSFCSDACPVVCYQPPPLRGVQQRDVRGLVLFFFLVLFEFRVGAGVHCKAINVPLLLGRSLCRGWFIALH
jgi:hypothetical protein